MTPFEFEQQWPDGADRVFDVLVDPRLVREVTLGMGAHDVTVQVRPGDGTIEVTIEAARRTPDGGDDERSVRTIHWSIDRRNATWDHVTLGYEDMITAKGSLHLVEISPCRTRLITRGSIHVDAGPMSARLERQLVAVFEKQADREVRLLQRRIERAVASP